MFEDVTVWDRTGPSFPTAAGTFTLEHKLSFARGKIEIRNYNFPSPVDDIWTKPRACVVTMALSERLSPSTIVHMDVGRASAPRDMGRIIMVPPGTTVRTRMAAGRYRAVYCVFDAEMIEEILQDTPKWDARALEESAHFRGGEIEWLLLKMYRELRQEDFGSTLIVEALANALCVELVRRFETRRKNERPRRGGLAPWRLRLVRKRAYADAPVPSLTDLADLCGMTVRQLCRAFKEETGQTVGKFVEAAMIDRASTLLSEANLSVTQVARRLGFTTSSNFAYAFRRATGLRPSDVASCQTPGATQKPGATTLR